MAEQEKGGILQTAREALVGAVKTVGDVASAAVDIEDSTLETAL